MVEAIAEVAALRRKVAELRKVAESREVAESRKGGARVGFVPTMGALHRGHAELLRVARSQADVLVASIFVNPLQFDRKDDLDRYPRTWEADLAICEEQGVDLVFAPTVQDLYPQEQLTFVDAPVLTQYLCGAFRPGHFRGVATVVLKLFNAVQPDFACFGEKDAQQLAVIRRMVADLNLPVEVVPVPTVREEDGLALSSRNKLLSAEDRLVAPRFAEALRAVIATVQAGEHDVARAKQAAYQSLAATPQMQVEYLELVDADTMTPVETIGDEGLLAAAVWLGGVRLIDNMRWSR